MTSTVAYATRKPRALRLRSARWLWASILSVVGGLTVLCGASYTGTAYLI